jgi:hypothetical protein
MLLSKSLLIYANCHDSDRPGESGHGLRATLSSLVAHSYVKRNCQGYCDSDLLLESNDHVINAITRFLSVSEGRDCHHASNLIIADDGQIFVYFP